jgi:dienelactone hydrolase
MSHAILTFAFLAMPFVPVLDPSPPAVGQKVADFTGAPGPPMITMDPQPALMDQPISIHLRGLPVHKSVRLKARSHVHGAPWEAHASFVADNAGAGDLAAQAPVAGSYNSVDPMGLFWSMKPEAEHVTPSGHGMPILTEPRVTSFELEMDGRVVATAECKRWFVRPGVRIRDIKEKGLVARLFEPAEAGKHPALLVLGGSEGGTDDGEAALLASRGYTALALAYFGGEGLPPKLATIPLEYVEQAADWLKRQDSVDGDRLGLVGGSKGAELALLFAASHPEFRAVIAHSPSSVVWQGLSGEPASSWSHHGKPLPFVPFLRTLANAKPPAPGTPIHWVEHYRTSLEAVRDQSAVAIPVEKIRGGVLFVSGQDDQLWPSALMADAMMQRLERAHFGYPYRHLSYPGAGHSIPSACIPTLLTVGTGRLALGGTPEANAKAQADSRTKVLRFLKEMLG